MKALQNQAVVTSEAPIVFSAIPRNSLRDRVGLIQFAPRRRVIQPAERSEADSRESPVKGIIRNPADPGTTRSGNVQDVRIEVGRGNMIVVVVHAESVCHAALTVGPPRAGVPVPPASEGNGFTILFELRDQFSPKLMLFCERRRPPPPPPPPLMTKGPEPGPPACPKL